MLYLKEYFLNILWKIYLLRDLFTSKPDFQLLSAKRVQCWQVDRECSWHLVITAHHCTTETGQKQVDINLTIFKTDYPGRKISNTYLVKTYNLNIETQENLHYYGIILLDCCPLYFIFNYFSFAFIAFFLVFYVHIWQNYR